MLAAAATAARRRSHVEVPGRGSGRVRERSDQPDRRLRPHAAGSPPPHGHVRRHAPARRRPINASPVSGRWRPRCPRPGSGASRPPIPRARASARCAGRTWSRRSGRSRARAPSCPRPAPPAALGPAAGLLGPLLRARPRQWGLTRRARPGAADLTVHRPPPARSRSSTAASTPPTRSGPARTSPLVAPRSTWQRRQRRHRLGPHRPRHPRRRASPPPPPTASASWASPPAVRPPPRSSRCRSPTARARSTDDTMMRGIRHAVHQRRQGHQHLGRRRRATPGPSRTPSCGPPSAAR